MIKEGNYLICKKSYYVFDDETLKQRIRNLLFGIPVFRKGKKYKVETVLINDENPYVLKYNQINIKFDIKFIEKYFYTKIEERKLKLKKLKL